MKKSLGLFLVLAVIIWSWREIYPGGPELELQFADVSEGDITPVDYSLNYFSLDVSGHVLGASGRQLRRIIDGGQSTELVYKFPEIVNGIHVMANGMIMVATDDDWWDMDKPCRIYLSTDHGKSFKHIKTIEQASALWWSLASDRQGNLYVGEYGPKGRGISRNVWKSTDYGKTWSVIFQAPDKESVHIHRVAVDPFTNYIWVTYGDEYRGIFVSRDSGSTWTKVGKIDPTGVVFTPEAIYWGEDSDEGMVTSFNRQTAKFETLLMASRFGNFGGSIYDLAVGKSGVIYAPTMQYPKETHNASLWVGKGDHWQLLMTLDRKPVRGNGIPVIGGPDRFGMLYITGYRIKDRPSW